ncbi:glycosyltransferase family 9 protein [Sediminicoccus sp. KRV36]|uniref:glycosyltransferase family 9 protein n=1 Tax=Sediminicoccus sp. KRV36 TaxID=3133721 RepID=UPI00200F19C4|nr:glycosyltransferase family 9 protein [Sediminicoccus rosea]UPY35545.1 glycosyltransferase family 9 protein [Sediminicoccus rosea]
MSRILVIKLAALGDFVQAFGPFAAIRAHHPQARITLLTTKPFAALAEASPWFDEVWSDGRPDWLDLRAVLRLALRLRQAGFARVYDLQTSSRSSRYRLFVGGGADWSGIARGASHPDADPGRDSLHTAERQRGQLRAAGITDFPAPALDWLATDISGLDLPERFALMLPGASPARPGKRWPAAHFAQLAARLGRPVVLCGGAAEIPLAREIMAMTPGLLDLTGRTDLRQLAAVARRASLAIGNDSGPTHLAAAAGCPTLALFGGESDPALCAPRGNVVVLRRLPLAGLSVEEVLQAASGLSGT